ncbi:MAG: flagellar basal body P-ring protein FlgI [Gammaproteobacteria bacterium]
MIIALLLLLLSSVSQAERIKDIAKLDGVRDNQLIGYGLVVGLNGSGDKVSSSPFVEQSMKSLLTQLGIVVPPGTKINPKNVAAVVVNADLPPFTKPGQKIDVTVSSVGDAKSLRGGTLLMTPLKGIDGNVYAIAQGNLLVGGLSAEGQDGSSVTVNIPSVGRVPNGATIEREVKSPFGDLPYLTFNLNQSDFTTAQNIAKAINDYIGEGTAKPMDATSIRVAAPRDQSQRVSFVSILENLEIISAESAAKVIVNSRTGTVVVNNTVRVSPVAISHGNIAVTVSEAYGVSQPGAFSDGETAVVPQSSVDVTEENNRMFLFAPGVKLEEIVRAVNQVGAAPSDIVAVLEALKRAGALKAELLVI